MGWLTAAEALAVLGIQPQTLYANVSRGRIRAKPDPKDSRRSLYHGGDVKRLAGRTVDGARPLRLPPKRSAGEIRCWPPVSRPWHTGAFGTAAKMLSCSPPRPLSRTSPPSFGKWKASCSGR